jgi:hypothetical protein
LIKLKDFFAEDWHITNNVRAFLAAYPETGIPAGRPHYTHFKNRILVYFDLLDEGGGDVNFEKIPKFRELTRRSKSICDPAKGVQEKATQNNGQLCPTTCN